MDAGQQKAYHHTYAEAQQKSIMDPEMLEAGRLLDSGNAPAAKAKFDVAGPRHPLSVNAFILGSRIDLAMGNTDRALDTLHEWEQKHPDYIELRRLRIEIHTARKEYPQAMQLARESNAKPDAQSLDLFLLARACYEAGKYQAAEKPLTDYLKLEAADQRALSMLSQLFLLTGRRTEVAALWRTAIEAAPADPGVAALGAKHLRDAGLLMDANNIIDAAAARFPGSAVIAFQHAQLLRSTDTQAAFDKFRLAATLDPTWQEPVLNAALILERAGHSEATAFFLQAADRCKDSASLQAAARGLLEPSPRSAILFLERALATDPASDDAWKLLSDCYGKLGDTAAAEAAARRDPRLLQNGKPAATR